MRHCLLLSLTASLAMMAAPATAQTVKLLYETTPSQQRSLLNAPIEYDEAGVVKAQYFKASELSPEELNAILKEAEKIKRFQAAQSAVTPVPRQYAQYGEPGATLGHHVVTKGDTLYNISRRYNTTVDQIRRANNISGTSISVGQALTIPVMPAPRAVAPRPEPTPSAAPRRVPNTSPVISYASAPTPGAPRISRVIEPVEDYSNLMANMHQKDAVYAVLPKDTLFRISRQTCTSIDSLVSTNGLNRSVPLQPGQRLTIPAGHCLPN